jgi:hypothetical protein
LLIVDLSALQESPANRATTIVDDEQLKTAEATQDFVHNARSARCRQLREQLWDALIEH